jgi:hypothetical protein
VPDERQHPDDTIIQPETAESPVTFVQRRRTIRMFNVTEQELATISAPSGSIHFGMFGITIGITATGAATLATVPLPDARTFSTFVLVTVGMAVLSVFFGSKSWADMREARTVIRRIREES